MKLHSIFKFAVFLAMSCLFAGVGFAQQEEEDDADTEDTAPVQAPVQDAQPVVEEVVVTGSRLRRDTYSSISPLQVITGQVSREIGQIDPASILQESTTAAGAQIDITFTGLVLDSGPGHSAIDLRGLGNTRTLVLINGRRVSPAGVEGAPQSPDLNLIPRAAVQQYEILLDGASSVYGSDAIAGVANIILRKDFDGFEFEAYSRLPEEGNGEDNTFSATWGRNFDRGFIGIAAEVTKNESVAFDDRPWTAGCNKNLEIDQRGQIRSDDLEYREDYGMKVTPCKIGFGRRAWDPSVGFGSIYYTPGESNTSIPNLSEATLFGIVLDLNQDGQPDVDFTDYNVNGVLGHGDLYPEIERTSAFAYGEYTFAGDMNITPYFELMYNRREHHNYDPGTVLFEEVPADNPFNPCNPNGLNGVDCGLAMGYVLSHPGYVPAFAARWGASPAGYCASGFAFLCGSATGPAPLEAQVSVLNDRDRVSSDVSQLRFVGGITGDLPQLNIGSMENWSFDLSFIRSDSSGESLRSGVNEQNLLHSLETSRIDPVTGMVTCGDGSDGCVPINLFAPSLYEGLVENQFATQAEWDYLYAARTFETTYTQSLLSYYMTGELFSLPGDTALGGIGFELRRDEMDSIPNDVARDGLLWGYFSDRGAVGGKDTQELIAEIELPLIANRPGVEEFTVNLSARYTKDEFYPGSLTYSGKLAYRPNNTLLLRGTVGTSYRAPNLRENFMLGQSGFRPLFDPCVVPSEAYDALDGYNPAVDERDEHVLENCRAAGVDPTTLGIIDTTQTSASYSVEVYGVGSLGLDEEKSESWTAGFSWEEPYSDAFDVTIGATYYDISLRDEVVRLHTQTSINDCYYDEEGDSAFCSNVHREDLGGGVFGLIEFGDEIFFNQDALSTRGVDVNLAFDWPAQIAGRAVDIGADLNLNRKLELEQVNIDLITGDEDREDYVGEFGYPEWEGLGIIRADVGNWRFTWSTRYIGSVAQDPSGVDDWSDVLDGGSTTCLGPTRGDFQCRDVGFADNYMRNDASVYYRGDTWSIGAGVRNLQNTWPPQVDSSEVSYVYNNTPLGRGYDWQGRTYFLNITANFQ